MEHNECPICSLRKTDVCPRCAPSKMIFTEVSSTYAPQERGAIYRNREMFGNMTTDFGKFALTLIDYGMADTFKTHHEFLKYAFLVWSERGQK